MTEVVTDKQIFDEVILKRVPKAQCFVSICTADIKDMYTNKGGKAVPFLEVLSDLIQQGVEVRLIHAKEPGPISRKEFDRYPALAKGLERMLCPRVHSKSIVIDGSVAFIGSANLTGAGMGMKGNDKRNFEIGIISDEEQIIAPVMDQFDSIWSGSRCSTCKRREYCADCIQ